MGRRDRSGSVNDTGNSAAGAGWPAALTLAQQREATFKKRCRLSPHFQRNHAHARETKTRSRDASSVWRLITRRVGTSNSAPSPAPQHFFDFCT